MAPTASQSERERLSFAKVAAMRLPTQRLPTEQYEDAQGSPVPTRTDEDPNVARAAQPSPPSQEASQDIDDRRDIETLDKSVQDLDINSHKQRGGTPESSGDGRDDGAIKGEGSFEDDQTHLSNSSTKPTSFDSKSMASVTTFAMDEKESLRPDDSASVQAAEEDDSFSGPASGAPNSQVGSEAGARLYQIVTSERVPSRARLNNSGLPETISSNGQSEQSLHGFPKDPDEKLLEAMNSPKDRLLILQLEEKIIAFIKDSNEQSLELPPCNAFGRLLAHKLGDYYHLTHFVDNNVTSVRLHRTPWCRLPTPLSMIQGPNANKTPPPNAPAMKIMRRTGQPGEKISAGGSTAPSSSAPSKATSDAGAEGNNEEGVGSSAGATPAKDRATLSREEREAKYQEVRERIFRDFPESKASDNSNSGDHSANMSRSNSGSGKRKGHRQRTPHDDSFEARSQFNAYYAGAPYSTAPIHYNGMMPDGAFAAQNQYLTSPSSPPSANFPHGNQVSPMYQPQGNMTSVPQYPVGVPPHLNQGNWQPGHMQQSPPYAGFSPINQLPPMVSQQCSTRSSPGMNSYAAPNNMQFQQNPSTWNQPQYSSAYSPAPAQRNQPVQWPNYPQAMNPSQVAYPYGQVPNQSFPPNSPGQHPLPGSFSRSPFNPQTRSFVPGSNSQPRFPTNTSQPTMGGAYLNPQYPQSVSWHGGQDHPNHSSSYSGSQGSVKTSAPPTSMVHSPSHGAPAGTHDSIAKWGTPSHLPPKPPPSEIPYDFELKNKTPALPSQPFPTVPASTPKSGGPLVVSGGMAHQRPRGNMTTGL
ncbi:hypothetical protein FQN52_004427 [Onygenales sp. PD_12]|nr:hypothetical protein FQN52_004427 [Onygenales sp. PD_12]KAK2781737.1 hypothetical protein FQN53_000421 [Emmonsiellopsis sp. PD_33]